MRHRIFGRQLGRTHNQRKALINGLIKSFFEKGYITTTEAKAKTVRTSLEKTITLGLKNDLISRRRLFAIFQDRHMVTQVSDALIKSLGEIRSNYTSITKVRRRQGDNALLVKLALVKPYQVEIKETPKKEKAEPKVIKVTPEKETKPIKKAKVTTKKSTK